MPGVRPGDRGQAPESPGRSLETSIDGLAEGLISHSNLCGLACVLHDQP